MSGFAGILGNSSLSGFSIISRYNAATEELFDYMTVAPPSGIRKVYNTLLVGLQEDPSLRNGGETTVWEETHGIWIWMGPNRQASYLNVRYPSLAPASDGVQPTHIPYQCIVGDTTQYVNLNYNPTTIVAAGGTAFSQDDSGIFVWCESNAGITASAMGATNGSGQGCLMNPRTATDIMQGSTTGANANIGSAGTTTDSSGFKMIRRVNATQIRTNKGGVAVGSELVSSSASVAPVNQSFYGLGRNFNGALAGGDSRAYSIMGITSGYADPVSLKTRFETFKS